MDETICTAIELKLERANALLKELTDNYFAPASYDVHSKDEDKRLEALLFIRDYPHFVKLLHLVFDTTLEAEKMMKKMLGIRDY